MSTGKTMYGLDIMQEFQGLATGPHPLSISRFSWILPAYAVIAMLFHFYMIVKVDSGSALHTASSRLILKPCRLLLIISVKINKPLPAGKLWKTLQEGSLWVP